MKIKLLSVLLVAAMSVFGLAASAYAQEAAEGASDADAPAAAKAEDAQQIKGKTLKQYWLAGGVTMYPLAICVIGGFSLVIYNFIMIRNAKFSPVKHVQKLTEELNNQNVSEAMVYCENNASPLTNIMGAGLARVNEKELNFEAIEEAISEASVAELAGPYVMVNYLALVASISPMVGLLGTVTGMIKAFNTIGQEGAGNAQRLADNISEALITTAVGLIASVPAMFFYFYFKSGYGKVTANLSTIVGDLVYTFKMSHKYGPQEIVELSADNKETK